MAASWPKIFTATSAFTPEITSSRRMAIGCVKLKVTPGIASSAAASASISASLSRPVVHVVDGMQADVDVALVDAHGLGGQVGPADLGDHLADLRETP